MKWYKEPIWTWLTKERKSDFIVQLVASAIGVLVAVLIIV